MYEKRIEKKRIYSGRILNLSADRVILENGKKSYRECVSHIGASAALPVLNETEIILVRQYRYCVQRELLEIPAGLIEPNETPDQTIKRELEEEIGYTPHSLEHILTYYSTPGFSDEKLHLFIAKDLKEKSGKLDDDEIVKPEVVKIDDAVNKIKKGEIIDGKTIIAILYYISKP